MSDTITVKIGGEQIDLPLVLNFATLERVWPCIKAMNAASDTIAETGAAIGMVAALLLPKRPELNAVEIKQRVRINLRDGTDERIGIVTAVSAIIRESGLIPAEVETAVQGEADPPAIPAETESPISTGSSPG